MRDLPSYTLHTMLYEGAERVLYRGVRDADGVPVVVKLFKDEHAPPRTLAKLRHEFTILRSIDWPGVIKAHALEAHGQSLALVLEDIGEHALSEHLQGKPLPLETALHIAHKLALILAGVHDQGVIHKDIKPLNILVDDRLESVHLIDFSIATRLSSETQAALRADSLEGTLAYLSPEQTGRMGHVVDYRTDFYSLGVTLYEMLTGALPFDSTDLTELVHSHIARTPEPPHKRAPDVPLAVSAIVMKLLAKSAEDRYQQARGLAADLERCINELREKGSIEPFELGSHDISDRLQIPEKLYGREAETEALLSAFDRVSQGSSELLLVTGAAGVGKSALVQELRKAIARRGGSFVTGKFDQLHREIPFACFAQAFRELISQLLGESKAKLAERKDALVAALGSNGQLLIDLIPELELIIGPQPEVAPLGPSESQNRLGMVMQSFVHVFCAPSHPLVLFIDDLQWADSASLWLLRKLLTAPGGGHLLVLGAYRDGEIEASHPLPSALDELRKQGVTPVEIKLGPLDLPSVRQLLAETLKERSRERIEPLAVLMSAKTQGNPFFLSQLLTKLFTTKLLRLDRSAGRWTWDESAIAAAPAADNVVEFVAARIKALDADTQRVLSLAACIGHQFDRATLSTIAELSPAQTSIALWPALFEQLILPVGGDYRLLPAARVEGDPARDPARHPARDLADDLNASYRFLHDRVQQAAYALIDPAQRAEVHLRIGRLLQKSLPAEPRAELRFEVVRHLNIGLPLIQDREERINLAQQNLAAGRVAMGAAAFAAAATLFAAGAAALDDPCWETHYDLTSALHREQATCEYVAGQLEQAEEHLEALLPRLRQAWERAEIFRLRLTLYITVGRFPEALNAGAQGLALVGIQIPKKEAAEAAFGAELAAADKALDGRSIASILEAPVLTNRDVETAIKILTDLKVPAYFVDPSLYPFLVVKALNLSLEHGGCPTSADVYATFGFFQTGILGRYAQGPFFGELALKFLEIFNVKRVATPVYFILAYFMPYGRPLSEARAYLDRVKELGLECGELLYGATGFSESAYLSFRLGEPLEQVLDAAKKAAAISARTKVVHGTEQATLMELAVACLQGRTKSPSTFSTDELDEEAFIARLNAIGGMGLHFFYLLKVQILSLHGDYRGAVEMIKAADQCRAVAAGQHWTTELSFHAGIAIAGLCATASDEEKPALLEELASHRATITKFADACPTNARHQQMLLNAESARIIGRPAEAVDAYEQAIALARKHDYPQFETLANELYGRFFMDRRQVKVARAYLSEAFIGYERWGATTKLEMFKTQYPSFITSSAHSSSSASSSVNSTHGTTTTQLIDVTAALRAAQAIASEIVLDKVVYRVMRIVLANAGAQRGFLLMNKDDELYVEAFLQVAPETVQVGLNTPLESRSDLAHSVVRYVARTKEPVVLNNASDDLRFAADPYVAARQPKSLLCIALSHQGRQRGVLYLENNIIENAFTAGRTELLEMLCTQAAIAVQNALLYTHVQDVSAKLQQANQDLEAQVADRTEALRSAYADLQRRTEELHEANKRLQHELTEREKAEAMRAALQDEVIQVQTNLLEELSTPLIPINDEILVLPLIGSVDKARADRMMGAVLHGVSTQKARAVIVDVTGLKQVDTQVADTLTRMTSALRLLGASAIITGMRPEVAQILVGLDADLTQVVTRGTLQSGIAYALRAMNALNEKSADARRGRNG